MATTPTFFCPLQNCRVGNTDAAEPTALDILALVVLGLPIRSRRMVCCDFRQGTPPAGAILTEQRETP
jgi:hypothetical protein